MAFTVIQQSSSFLAFLIHKKSELERERDDLLAESTENTVHMTKITQANRKFKEQNNDLRLQLTMSTTTIDELRKERSELRSELCKKKQENEHLQSEAKKKSEDEDLKARYEAEIRELKKNNDQFFEWVEKSRQRYTVS